VVWPAARRWESRGSENWPEDGRFEGREAVIRQYMWILEEWGSEGGKIVEGRFFWDFDEALEAVGLRGEADK
jgi:hypothetical protein